MNHAEQVGEAQISDVVEERSWRMGRIRVDRLFRKAVSEQGQIPAI